jgi:hypothetical protein
MGGLYWRLQHPEIPQSAGDSNTRAGMCFTGVRRSGSAGSLHSLVADIKDTPITSISSVSGDITSVHTRSTRQAGRSRKSIGRGAQ